MALKSSFGIYPIIRHMSFAVMHSCAPNSDFRWPCSRSPSYLSQMSPLHPPDADFSNNPLSSNILVSREGFTLLACPNDPLSFCELMMMRTVEKVKEVLSMQTTRPKRLTDGDNSFALMSCPPQGGLLPLDMPP